MASLGQALEKTQIKPLVNAQGVITGWAVDLGGADPDTLRYWAGAGIFVGTEIILPTSAIDLIPGAGKGLKVITRGTERVVVEEATGKVLGKVETADVPKGAADDFVDLSSGCKGAWCGDLNKPKPNTNYKVDDNYAFSTDSLGRTNKVEGELNLSTKDRNKYQQCKAGICGNADDEGGHLIASIFNGPGEKINLVPMNGNLNKGEWKKLENTWAGALNEGKSVRVAVEPVYSGNTVRPVSFKIEYSIGNGRPIIKVFQNTPGGI